MKIKNQEGFSAVEGLLLLVIAGIIGGAGWYVWDSNKKANESLDNANASSKIDTKEAPKVSVGMKLLNTDKYSVEYPEDWKAYKEGEKFPIENSDTGTTTEIKATSDFLQDPKDGVGSSTLTISAELSKSSVLDYMEETFPNGQAPQGEIKDKQGFKVGNYSALRYSLVFMNPTPTYKVAVSNGSKVIFFDYSASKAEQVDKIINSLKIK